jgi:hypothetical protein
VGVGCRATGSDGRGLTDDAECVEDTSMGSCEMEADGAGGSG